MWINFLNILSTEALGDEFSAIPAGGSAEGDGEINESNEQFNEGDLSDTFDDFDMGGDEFGDSSYGDMSDSGGTTQGLGTMVFTLYT
jgi:hypothetical protein